MINNIYSSANYNIYFSTCEAYAICVNIMNNNIRNYDIKDISHINEINI